MDDLKRPAVKKHRQYQSRSFFYQSIPEMAYSYPYLEPLHCKALGRLFFRLSNGLDFFQCINLINYA